MLVINNQG